MSLNIDDKTNENAYKLLRHLYKYIPLYNQLKGSYIGMQFVLNTMGLNLAMTELWARKDNLTNFADSADLAREDEINADREIKKLSGISKTDYRFLTSRFDADLMQSKAISFEAYNAVAPTVYQVISQMRPITRVFRKLFYISRLNNDTYFKYFTNIVKEAGDIKSFKYIWNLSDPRILYLHKYDKNTNGLYSIFIPYQAEYAEYTSEGTNTLKNTYFNLFELERKLLVSNQKTLEFTISAKRKNEEEYQSIDYMFTIGKDIDIESTPNGINLTLHDTATSILIDIFGIDNIPPVNDIDLKIEMDFNIVLGSKYIYQGDLINKEGLITELEENDIISELLSFHMGKEDRH